VRWQRKTNGTAERDSWEVFYAIQKVQVMSANEVGELLYTVTLNITGIKEYGVSFAASHRIKSDEP
jgi:hypothetical protein